MNTPVVNQPVEIPSLHDAESQRLAARMTELARAMAECEGIDRFAETGWLPDSFFTTMAELYKLYDAYIAHNLATSELKIVCKFGCTRCCHQAVHGMFAFEAIALYRRLRPLPDYAATHAALADYAGSFEATLEQIADADDGDPAEPMQRTLEAFAAAAAPCPLLAGSHCSVYTQRPFACRSYHSLTDPLFCTTAQGRTFNIDVPAAAAEILWSLSDRLAYPFPTLLAQGLVTLAERRQSLPWVAPVA